MFKAPSRRLLVRASLAVLSLGVAASTQANHSWGGYHWARTSNPFTLKAGNNLTSPWEVRLDQTIGDWNQSTVLDLTKVAGGAKPRNCRPTSGRIEVCNASYGNNGWLGVASIWITGGTHITQGTAKMNDYYFNQPQYNTDSWRELVMCQEVAHTFGLDHQDENFNNANLGTCMDYTSKPDGPPSNTAPNKGDYDELLCIYDPAYNGRTLTTSTHSCTGTGHLDSSTTIGQLPPAMNNIDFSNPANWGRLVKSGNAGRTQTFEQDFGHGNKVITFVIWAEAPRGNRGE